jgi:Lipopolysaccharide-assembly
MRQGTTTEDTVWNCDNGGHGLPCTRASVSLVRIRALRGYVLMTGLVFVATLSSGCGYALAGRGAFLPSYIRTIGVPTFTNRTTIFNIETLLTEKVRAEFIGRGKYQILPESGGVDALLTGEVTGVGIAPASFSTTQIASRYALTMTARIELKDVRANKVLWENPSIFLRQEYEATTGTSPTDPTAFFQQDLNALDRMSAEFARTIVSAILEAF